MNKPILLVMAAGAGSRYGGVKQIEGVGKNDETLLDYSIFDAVNAGFGKIVFVIRHDIEKDFKERLFDRISSNYDAVYCFQEKTTGVDEDLLDAVKNRIKPWGTLQCVIAAKKHLDSNFAVLNSDDFYGRDAFVKMAEALKSDNAENVMIGYKLLNTLSDNGSVTRGVCRRSDKYLSHLEETYKIQKTENGIIGSTADGKCVKLTGDETVSMNFFGFNKNMLDMFKSYWDEFIKKNAREEKMECLIPVFVDEYVEKHGGKIRMLESNDRWFGMTYKEDKETVHKAIISLLEEGKYPASLY